MEQLADFAPMVQILDAPVPQMVNRLVDVLKLSDGAIPEQVIELSMVLCPSRPLRAALAATQMAEQLVEVQVPKSVILACCIRLDAARGRSLQRKKKRRKKKLPRGGARHQGGPCNHAVQAPAVLADRQCASDSVHRPCVGHSCDATETGTHSANGAEDGRLHRCSAWGRLLTRPSLCNNRCQVDVPVNMLHKFQQFSARGGVEGLRMGFLLFFKVPALCGLLGSSRWLTAASRRGAGR